MDYRTSTVELRSGLKLPSFGLGTFLSEPSEIDTAVTAAFDQGYVMVDTARMYGNERDVGAAIAKSGKSREQFAVVSKLLPDDHGRERAVAAAEESVQMLGIDSMDLFLIHNPKGKDVIETWKGMLEVKRRGLVRPHARPRFLRAG